MSELLLHLIEVEPPADPVARQTIEIAQNRLRYGDENLDNSERVAAFEAALDGLRSLIADNYDRRQRPIWQVNLAEMLLYPYLQGVHNYADLFYEFGQPTPEQQEAYARAVAEAYEATADAAEGFFRLRGELGRNEQLTNELQATGEFFRIQEYEEKRLPFYLASSAYSTALLPDDAAYFRDLSTPNPKIPGQAKGAKAERERLLKLVQDRLEPYVSDTSDGAGIRLPALSVAGRAALEAGQAQAARDKMLVPASQNSDKNVFELAAELALVKADWAAGQQDAARQRLEVMFNHPQVRPLPLFQLLLADLHHRLLMSELENPDAAPNDQLAAAYQPYVTMLGRNTLDADQRESLKNYLYLRWANAVDPAADPTKLPPMVLLAVTQMKRFQGTNDVLAAQQSDDAAQLEQGQEALQTAIRYGEQLQEEDIDPAIRAEGMFHVAIAKYLLNPQQLGNLLEVVNLLTTIAEQMPDQPAAEEALSNALQISHQLYGLEPRPVEAEEAYTRAMRVALKSFNTAPATDNERVYYAFFVLQQNELYDEAAEVYRGVPYDHPTYFEAQRELLFSLAGQMRAADEKTVIPIANRLTVESERVAAEAAKETSSSDPARARSAQSAGAAAVLLGANAMAAKGQPEEAVEQLEGFEQRFEDVDPALVEQAMADRIMMLVQAQRLDLAGEQAQAMIDRFPDAAAAVINSLIDQLDAEIDELRERAAATQSSVYQQELEERATQRAQVAAKFADYLLQWAKGQGFQPREMLPFQLILVKTQRLAGRPDDAYATLQPLMKQYPDDPQVLLQQGETLFQKGDEASMIAAGNAFNRLIATYQSAGVPFPEVFWNAWMRRLQINDRLGQYTEDIPLRVRQLEHSEPTLGGEPYRSALQALRDKYEAR